MFGEHTLATPCKYNKIISVDMICKLVCPYITRKHGGSDSKYQYTNKSQMLVIKMEILE